MNLRSLLIALSLVTVAFGSTVAVATHDTSDCELGDAPGETIVVPLGDTGQAGDLYINDRPADGNPAGTGLVEGDGTWIYQESNDIDGLQTDDSTSDQELCTHSPDTLIF